jgi:hypothetical protein
VTTIFPFATTPQSPFQFQPTLDGTVYNVTVTWNLFGQRYYINVTTLGGELILCEPLIGSPSGLNLQALTWALGQSEATTVAPHGFAIGQTLALNVSGATPDAFNGDVRALITGRSTFSYPLTSYPGQAIGFGIVNYNINLLAGYFTSVMVFREAAQQFEVSP